MSFERDSAGKVTDIVVILLNGNVIRARKLVKHIGAHKILSTKKLGQTKVVVQFEPEYQ